MRTYKSPNTVPGLGTRTTSGPKNLFADTFGAVSTARSVAPAMPDTPKAASPIVVLTSCSLKAVQAAWCVSASFREPHRSRAVPVGTRGSASRTAPANAPRVMRNSANPMSP